MTILKMQNFGALNSRKVDYKPENCMINDKLQPFNAVELIIRIIILMSHTTNNWSI